VSESLELTPDTAWAIGYAIRSTLAENAKHIRDTREALATPGAPGVVMLGLRGSLKHAEELQELMWDRFESLPESIRPNREDARYSTGSDA